MLRHIFVALAATLPLAPVQSAIITGLIESGGVGFFRLPSIQQIGEAREYILSFEQPTESFSGLGQTLVIYQGVPGQGGQGVNAFSVFTTLDDQRFLIAPPPVRLGDFRPLYGTVIGIDETRVVFFPTFSTPGPVAFSVDIAPIPEPAIWAMMIGGFGLIGSAYRVRRSHLVLG